MVNNCRGCEGSFTVEKACAIESMMNVLQVVLSLLFANVASIGCSATELLKLMD